MAARSSWDGFLRLSLISVPVRAYNAAVTGKGDVHFHQIHAGCGSRIQYKKFCPVHGEVTKDEIVSGYEYAKGEYVLVKPEELSKLRSESDKAITIETFIEPNALDPLFFADRAYYLLPDGPPGQKPYAVLQRVMAERDRYAVAQVVFSGREETVLIRPVGRLLVMTMLSYENQVKKPSAFEDELPEIKVSGEEVKLAESLIDASTAKEFDFSKYKDLYTERLTQLISAKAQGREIVAVRKREEPVVINLMDALRRSLDRAGKSSRRKAGHGAAAKHTRSRSRKKTG